MDSMTFGHEVISQAMTNSQRQAAYEPQLPFALEALAASPRMTPLLMNSVRRGGRTVLYGGWADNGRFAKSLPGAPTGKAMSFRRQARHGFANANLYNPRNWGSFRNMDMLFPDIVDAGQLNYTPFQGARFLNYFGKSAAARGSGDQSLLARAAGRISGGAEGRLARIHEANNGLFQQGALSRISAAGRVMNMSDRRYARMVNKGALGKYFEKSGAQYFGGFNQQGMAQQILSTVDGGLSGRLAGFISGISSMQPGGHHPIGGTDAFNAGRTKAVNYASKLGVQGTDNIRTIGKKTIGTIGSRAEGQALGAYLKASSKTARQGAMLAGGKFALSTAGRAIPVAGWAWTAYDFTKFNVVMAGRAARLSAEAYTSLQGGLNTRVGSPLYTDTDAAKTSRSRGVQAIQNSRLNARSLLGSEAGAMAGHFG